MADEDLDASTRSFGLTFTLLVVVGVIALAAQSGVPGLHGLRSRYQALWPQGWSFFSDAPSSDVTYAYQVDRDSGALTLLTQRQSDTENAWGLRRGGYSQMAEVQALRLKIPATVWVTCGDNGRACVRTAGSGTPYVVVNSSRHPTICAEVNLITEPVKSGTRRGQHAVLTVKC